MFTVQFRPEVIADDLDNMPQNMRERVLRAIRDRLTTEPAKYGERLRKSLTGLWKMRCGDYRVAFEIEKSRVTVWCIGHRRAIYEEVLRRRVRH